eukprot:scaffold13320_cov118-Isochrysis_galbana.AAC.3
MAQAQASLQLSCIQNAFVLSALAPSELIYFSSGTAAILLLVYLAYVHRSSSTLPPHARPASAQCPFAAPRLFFRINFSRSARCKRCLVECNVSIARRLRLAGLCAHEHATASEAPRPVPREQPLSCSKECRERVAARCRGLAAEPPPPAHLPSMSWLLIAASTIFSTLATSSATGSFASPSSSTFLGAAPLRGPPRPPAAAASASALAFASAIALVIAVHRRFGESLSDETHEWSSPTKMTGHADPSRLKASLVHFALRTTFCSQSASFLFSLRSKTCTLPSAVQAANVVDDQGVHATSPTWLFRSNDSSAAGRM